MSNMQTVKNIYSQRVPGKLLRKTFSHARKDNSRRIGTKGINAYYFLDPNLSIFESAPFLFFNKTRYSPRHRCDKIIQEIMLAPAVGERFRDAEIRSMGFQLMRRPQGVRQPRVYKRHVSYTNAIDRDAGRHEDRDIVYAHAVISPWERPELQRHKRLYSYNSIFDFHTRKFFESFRNE